VEDIFGESNFGEVGMHSFFKTHNCNKVIIEHGVIKEEEKLDIC